MVAKAGWRKRRLNGKQQRKGHWCHFAGTGVAADLQGRAWHVT